MKVLKFGGSSLANPESIREVVSIILKSAKNDKIVVVVSAFHGVTNQLLECAMLAAAGEKRYEVMAQDIANRHLDTLYNLHSKHAAKQLATEIQSILKEFHEFLQGIYLLRDCSPRASDAIASFGERLCAQVIASFLNQKSPAEFVDARQLIVTDAEFTHATVLFEKTNTAVRHFFKKLFNSSKKSTIPIVTGFIAATEEGITTTIGRNGSDYSAAIIGAAIDAAVIEIWTDVDGVYSADPRSVKKSFVLPRLSYEEAMELSYFGAKVLHTSTIAPAITKNIPVLIKNTFNPEAPGTLIEKNIKEITRIPINNDYVKGITSIDECCLLTLRSIAMVGVPGVAERLFRSLAIHQINVILISQASSEHTICLAISQSDAVKARQAISHEFRFEFQQKLAVLDEKNHQSIIAIVGDGMKGVPGISGKLFNSLGQNNISINAIAQGASERNISLVVDSVQRIRSLNVIHEGFFEKRKCLSIILVGVGNIGSTLLRQLQHQTAFLHEKGFEIKVCGVTNSKKLLVKEQGIDLASWQDELQHSPFAFNVAELIKQVAALQLVNVALVDCTASSSIVDAYPEFVSTNMHIVTPNKKANVLPWKRYHSLLELLKSRQKHFLYEANVGAGLPVISTLQDLIAGGDTIIKIEGILSGTLSYLFNSYDGSYPFSELVKEAHAQGFTEPDPREDLSGMDVARKLLILGRQLGHKMELKNIKVENLVPMSLRKKPYNDNFYKQLSQYDSALKRRISKALTQGMVLRYVGSLFEHQGRAGIHEIPLGHPLAATKSSDNIFTFTTKRYFTTPLVVQGPGAGAEVTAMGVFSDLLKLLHYLP